MINHVRTLLLNRGQDGQAPDVPGEEYVVPKYRARVLPPELRLAWQVLFGNSPDRIFLNYRLRQIMTLLHTSELEPLVYAKDTRVTYWPPVDTTLFDRAFGRTTQRLDHTKELFVLGQHLVDESAGRCKQTWTITVNPGAIVQVNRGVNPGTFEYPASYANGLSQIIPLEGSGYTIRIPEVPGNTTWQLTSVARPTTDLGEVLLRLSNMLGEDQLRALFFDTTLHNVWRSHPLSACRYAALLLAFADAIEQIPVRD